jgi:putative DNA primase/helicase
MNVEDAVKQACADVGILPPKSRSVGRWIKADTLSGKNGKGDGRLMINDAFVVAHNWQTGISIKVSLLADVSEERRREIRAAARGNERKREDDAKRAEGLARRLVANADMATHPYLERKGFPDEQVLTIGVSAVRNIVGKASGYLIAGDTAIVMPARIGADIKSVQLIWEDGTKKFLFGGIISGASHRVCVGRNVWLCEGFATGLSLRQAFRGMNYSATLYCCFSASNVGKVAAGKPSLIAADNDKPVPQYNDIGAGEYFAGLSGRRFVMPPTVGDDFNDMHQNDGIFAVQRLLSDFIREARMKA